MKVPVYTIIWVFQVESNKNLLLINYRKSAYMRRNLYKILPTPHPGLVLYSWASYPICTQSNDEICYNNTIINNGELKEYHGSYSLILRLIYIQILFKAI